MGCDGQTVLNLAGTGTTILSGQLFPHPNIFGWIVWRKPMGSDRQTVFDFGGNWLYKNFGRIVLRSKLIFWGTDPTIFWVDCLAMSGDGQTV